MKSSQHFDPTRRSTVASARRGSSLAVLALTTLGLAPLGDSQIVAPAAADDAAGHCQFSLKNQWVGPLKACMAPTTAAQCEELGKKDENSGAVFASGACPATGVVGVCRTDKGALTYYEGDAGGLEMGCGFQSGEWSTPK